MLLRRDSDLEIYGFRTMDSLFPWDSMGREHPERIAPLLDSEFIDEWAALPLEDGGTPSPSAPPPRTGDGKVPAASAETRKLKAAQTRLETARRELETAEDQARSARQEREGFETWAQAAGDEVRRVEGQVDAARKVARAEEQKLDGLREQVAEVERELVAAEAETGAARKRFEATAGSIRIVRRLKQVKRVQARMLAQADLLAQARREEQRALAELEEKEAALERALSKIDQVKKGEGQAKRTVTRVRQKVIRAELALAKLTAPPEESATPPASEVRPEPPDRPEAGEPEAGEPEDGWASAIEREAAEKEVEAAKRELGAAEAEARAAREMLGVAELEAEALQQRFLAYEVEARLALRMLEEVEGTARAAEMEARAAQPVLEEAAAEAESAKHRFEAVRGTARVVLLFRRSQRAQRKARSHAAFLETSRREAEEGEALMQETKVAVDRARDKVDQLLRVETEALRSLTLARRRHGRALGALTKLLAHGQDHEGIASPPYQYILLVRDRQLLGSLSLGEWSRRASGHGFSPKFVLEQAGEAIWLYKGEWFTADSELRVDDLMVLMDEVARAPRISQTGRSGLDSAVAALVWERDGGRCVHCGSMANVEIDRIIPAYLGGSSTPGNLQLLCRNCVRDKSHRL